MVERRPDLPVPAAGMERALKRHIAAHGERERYGDWELAGDEAITVREPATDVRYEDPTDQEYEIEVRQLMIRQRRLSLAAAVILFGAVFAVTVSGYLFPEALNEPSWHGFSPAVFFGAVAVYPLTWLVAAVYTVISNRLDGLG